MWFMSLKWVWNTGSYILLSEIWLDGGMTLFPQTGDLREKARLGESDSPAVWLREFLPRLAVAPGWGQVTQGH